MSPRRPGTPWGHERPNEKMYCWMERESVEILKAIKAKWPSTTIRVYIEVFDGQNNVGTGRREEVRQLIKFSRVI